MKQDNSTMQKAIEWWGELKTLSEKCPLLNKYGFDVKRPTASITKDEIFNIYLSEHPEQAVKEESQDNSKEGVILGEENTVLAKWYLIPTSFKPIGELRDIIIAEMDIDVTNNIEAENTSLKARIVLLEDALNMVLGIEDAAFGLRGFDAKRLKSEIKKALNQK